MTIECVVCVKILQIHTAMPKMGLMVLKRVNLVV